jgi:hypothetical protein
MANYIGACRSNYFRVKDVNKFREAVGVFDVELIERDGLIGFLSNDDSGMPHVYEDVLGNDLDDPRNIDEVIVDHLDENEVCVIVEAGSEKLRYVRGWAMAIHSSGERVNINIGDIYKLAQEEFGGDANITEAVY